MPTVFASQQAKKHGLPGAPHQYRLGDDEDSLQPVSHKQLTALLNSKNAQYLQSTVDATASELDLYNQMGADLSSRQARGFAGKSNPSTTKGRK